MNQSARQMVPQILNRERCTSDAHAPVQPGARTVSAGCNRVGRTALSTIVSIILLATLIQAGCSGVTSVRTASSASSTLVIVTKSLPIAQAGSQYAVQLVASGVAPYHWALISGTLPPGLILSADGFLQGIPQQSGRFDFVVEVQDASNNTARLEVTSTIGEQA
jgi:hypothetical protein